MDRKTPTRSIEGALADAYDRHGGGLYRYAAVVLADPVAAEDAVQAVFCRLARVLSRGAQIASLERYLRRSVRNEWFTMLRDRKRERSNRGSFLEPVETAVSPVDRLTVETALTALPAEQREVLHLRLYEGLTFEEIAERTSVSINTATSRYRYGLSHLREALSPAGENGNDHVRSRG